MSKQDVLESLERILGENSLANVVYILAEIAYKRRLKTPADQREGGTRKEWGRAGDILSNATLHIDV